MDFSFSKSNIENLQQRKELNDPLSMGPLLLTEITTVCSISYMEERALAWEKSHLIFSVIGKTIQDPNSLIWGRFWQLFQDNSLVAFECFPCSIGILYWNRLKDILLTFLSSHKEHSYSLVKFLEFANDKLTKWKKIYLSVLVICIDNLPGNFDAVNILQKGINKFLSVPDQSYRKDQIHLIEHFVSSSSVDFVLMKLGLNTLNEFVKHSLNNDEMCTYYSIGTIIRVLSLMGIENLTDLMDFPNRLFCCRICMCGIRCAAAIAFAEQKKGQYLADLPPYSQCIAKELIKNMTDWPPFREQDMETGERVKMWWTQFMEAKPEVDGAILKPGADILKGCSFTDNSKPCPIGDPDHFRDDEPQREEWKVVPAIMDALEKDASYDISVAKGPFKLSRETTEPAAPLPIEAPPSSPRAQNDMDVGSSETDAPLDDSEARRYKLRGRRTTCANKEPLKTKKRPSLSPKAKLILNGLSPNGKPSIAAKTDALFSRP